MLLFPPCVKRLVTIVDRCPKVKRAPNRVDVTRDDPPVDLLIIVVRPTLFVNLEPVVEREPADVFLEPIDVLRLPLLVDLLRKVVRDTPLVEREPAPVVLKRLVKRVPKDVLRELPDVLRVPVLVFRVPPDVLRVPRDVLRVPAEVLRLPRDVFLDDAFVCRLPLDVPRERAKLVCRTTLVDLDPMVLRPVTLVERVN